MVDKIRRIPTTIQFRIFLITYMIHKNLQMKIKNYKINWWTCVCVCVCVCV